MLRRNNQGQNFYVSSMEKSAKDKARLFPFVRGKLIVDMGAGAGPLSELLSIHFPESKIIAVDCEQDMIVRLKKRFKENPRIKVVKSNVQTFSCPEKVDTVIFTSVLHEVFSFKDYSHQEVIETLKNVHKILTPGGRLIIRDGIQPEQETLYLRAKNSWAYEKFNRFVKNFRVRPIVFCKGVFNNDSFIQQKPKDYEEFEKKKFFIEMHSQDASELLSKYFYSEDNWEIELKEQFGIWSLREYQHVLIDIGYHIVYAETYVLPYLIKEHYSKDFDVYRLENGYPTKIQYPPSTMILVAEKS